jgi:Protein of unknown function (DUF2786)
MTTPNLKILDRIRKLLALAQGQGGTVNEVYVAATEAARLMQLHKLTLADIPEHGDSSADMVDLPAGADFLDSWRFVLVSSVARSFMCDAIGLCAAERRKVRVVGRREDVEVVLEVYGHVAGEIERLTASYVGDLALDRREPRSIFEIIFNIGKADQDFIDNNLRRPWSPFSVPADVGDSRRGIYRDGLVVGVVSRLREQQRGFESSHEKALTIVKKSRAEILDYMTNKFAGPRTVPATEPVSGTLEDVDFARGFRRGQEIQTGAKKEEEPGGGS